MATYDFTTLSPSDFEALSHDLLESSLNIPLQSFTTGRDRGIDLRYAPVKDSDWIVQCKHFAGSGFANLLSNLKTKELPKIQALNPGRYILATSVGLTPPNVDKLFKLLSPFCKSKQDILGRDDLNSIIRRFPEIEQTHFKLWLSSEPVLSKVLHNNVFVQSWLTEEKIKRRLSLYVYTDSLEKARAKLAQEHVCIISGVPGIGKTTLAEMLLVEYLANDWQVIALYQNIDEALKLFQKDRKRKQLFYYDDFLGQISSGEKLGKNEDRVLLQLMDAASASPRKRFILTTREYILAQAKAEHEHLARSSIDFFKFVITCQDYSDLEKAQILANHLYFSGVPQEHISALVGGRKYSDIIFHQNYSPRIVEIMTQTTEACNCDAQDYPTVFLERLNNPSDIWKHAFENQICEASRDLLLVFASCGDSIYLSDLEQAFNAFHLGRAQQYAHPSFSGDFRKSLNELEGDFIQIERVEANMIVQFHNPSILDYLKKRFLEDHHGVMDILRYATCFEQVERLFHVFGVADSIVARNDGQIDLTIVRNAIEKTLLAKGICLARSNEISGRWFRTATSVWNRLGICCEIGSQFNDKELHAAVRRLIVDRFDAVAEYSYEIQEITRLLGVLELCVWFDAALWERCKMRVKESVLARESEFEESLDGLSALAGWLAENRSLLDEEEEDKLLMNLGDAVTREVDNEIGSGRDRETLNGHLAIVQEISKTLAQDFTQEERWLNEAITQTGSRSDYDDDVPWSSHRSTGACSSSIESVFDSLLE